MFLLIKRVQLGKLEDFIKTSCLTSLTFMGEGENGQGKLWLYKINIQIKA